MSSIPFQAPPHFPTTGGGSGGGSPPSGTPPSTGQPSGTSTSGGTRTWNDFKGRDPDLVFAGETVTADGKSYTFKAGDTLADAAKALGMDTKALAEKSGMDMALWGQNAQGQYFTPGGPQPAPGGSQNPPIDAPGTGSPAPTTPGGTPSGGADRGTYENAPPEHKAYMDKEPEKAYALIGGALDSAQATDHLTRIADPTKTGSLNASEVSELKAILLKAHGANDGLNLTAAEKYLYNKYMISSGLA